MATKFNIDISCVVITTDMTNGKIFILSLDPETLKFPILTIDKNNSSDIHQALVDTIKRYLMTNDMELTPQIINMNHSALAGKKKTVLNAVAGFLIKENVKNFDSHWIDFDFKTSTSALNPVIFEVIQRLQ